MVEAITELGVGEALISVLDEKGIPTRVERAWVLPPHSRLTPLTPEERSQVLKGSKLFGVYEQTFDRESAYELLKRKTELIKVEEAAREAAEEARKAEKNSRPPRPTRRARSCWTWGKRGPFRGHPDRAANPPGDFRDSFREKVGRVGVTGSPIDWWRAVPTLR